MRILFLDDDQGRQKDLKRLAVGAVIDRASSARDAIHLLQENPYDRVYLDYDLDDDPSMRKLDDYEGGQVVADWLAENAEGRQDCLFVIHSRNRRGANDLQGTLRSAGLRVIVGEWDWRIDHPSFLSRGNAGPKSR